jgi:hypothetical protein
MACIRRLMIIRLHSVTCRWGFECNRLISTVDLSLLLIDVPTRNRKLQDIVRVDEAEDYAHEKWESSPGSIMHYEWFDKLILPSAGLKLAAAGGEHIFDPPAISAVGKRNQVPADGFYEWQRSGKTKQPFCFEVRDGEGVRFMDTATKF